MKPDQHLSPAEAAKRLGVTVKALRLYEARGLVAPVRSRSGWRSYGPAAMAELHQVLALKRLGLPLREIAALKRSRGIGLDAVLALQEQVLRKEGQKVAHALSLIVRARAQLKSGRAFTVDDLATLTMETAMSPKATKEELKEIFSPLIEKHYSERQLAELKKRTFDQQQVSARWDELFAEANRLMAAGDTTSAAAMTLARRWNGMIEEFANGDPKLRESARRVWADAMADPAAEPKLPVGCELYDFVARVMANLRKS